MADEIGIDFENEVAIYTDWTFTNMTSQQTGSIIAHKGTYYGTTGGKATASIATKSKINQPTQIKFYVSKQSTNKKASDWKIQVSSDNTTWTDVKTQSATSMSQGTWEEVTQNLSAYSDVYIRVYYTGSTAVRNIDDLVLTYTAAVVDPQKPEVPSFSLDAGTYYIKSGESKQVELTTDVEGGHIYYTTDGQDPITAGTEYTSALTLTTTTTLKACVKKGEYYSNVVSSTYTILPSIANTEETAYTTTEAITIIDKKSAEQLADEAEKVYVTGVVSKVDDINDGAITYWLDGNTFEVYKGKNIDNKPFKVTSDVTLGAEVIVYGNLKKYGSTYELDAGNYLVSYQASTATLQSVTIERGSSVKTNYLEGESFDKTGLVAYANYNDGSKLDVTSSAKWTITPTDLTASDTQVTVYATFNDTKSAESTIDINVSPAITINLSTADQVTTADADKLEWKLEKLTITAEKYNSQTPTNNYYPKTSGKNYTSTRFYTDSKLTFTPSATIRIDKIIYTATTANYATAMSSESESGSKWTNASASADDKTVTITPKNGLLPVSAVIGGTTGGTKIVVGYTDLTEFHTRNTAAGSYGTVCLPKDAKVVGAKIYDVTDANVNTVSITEVNGDVLEAGKPYVYKATADNQSFYCASDDDLIVAGTNGALVGSYEEKRIVANNGNYILSGNAFHFVNSDNVKVGANRAYIHLDVSEGARLLIVEGDTETGICLPVVDAEEKAESTGVYDLSGRRVVNAKSGVYVQNGKLFIK